MVGNRKAETTAHSILKYLIASLIEKKGHKAVIECQISQDSIIDVFDFTDKIAYEVQTIKNKRIEEDKLRKYLRASVKDVFFIYTKEFSIYLSASSLYKLLKFKLGL